MKSPCTGIYCVTYLTSYSSILPVPILTLKLLVGCMRTADEGSFITTAANIVQVDWTNTSTKGNTTEGNCICKD